MDGMEVVTLTPENIGEYGVCGYKNVQKHVELQRKIDWMKKYQPLGLTIKVLVVQGGGAQGMIEYIPGEYAHRPVNAEKYMFIHCLFVGFKKEYKGKGLATQLIRECMQDTQKAGLEGVAVVTRKGSFMVDRDIFLKLGFEVVDSAPPDFELCVLKFNQSAFAPHFREEMDKDLNKFAEGLTIMRSAQCPYSVKNVDTILESATTMGVPATLIELEDAESAQSVPCPFGSFCIIYNGEIIAHHPISGTRFKNIMDKKLNVKE